MTSDREKLVHVKPEDSSRAYAIGGIRVHEFSRTEGENIGKRINNRMSDQEPHGIV